ncbi:short-chain dehydrogenase [Acinetobacter sp. NCu2D-2]|uniref:SDR family oxidoreductase n=1 Tax=Acinetobacter sp. NCu2D-2 TaxID=1608473 RepID=UPI0007CDCCB7|nr:SDR family oxidoreductase [Acinetobacter sp. NCu2D-2]ANF81064.1 short-chain dehydrogenase [Acinetobacter sp. NCu2D-2]
MYSIFISGAAQGIGAAVAKRFYQKGYKVGIYDVNLAQAETVAATLGIRAKAGYLNVADYASWQTALQDFEQWAGEVNILVNNAGILYSGAFEQSDIADHHRTVDVNIKGVMNGCHAALPYLKNAAFARVINLSSASAIYGQADLASYSASKFAVRGLTEGLDIEWQKYGIRVLDVMPLFVQTAMVKDMDAASIKKMGVNLSAEDVAADILKLAECKARAWTPTHRPVGLKSQFLFHLSRLSPQWMNRASNLFIAKK